MCRRRILQSRLINSHECPLCFPNLAGEMSDSDSDKATKSAGIGSSLTRTAQMAHRAHSTKDGCFRFWIILSVVSLCQGRLWLNRRGMNMKKHMAEYLDFILEVVKDLHISDWRERRMQLTHTYTHSYTPTLQAIGSQTNPGTYDKTGILHIYSTHQTSVTATITIHTAHMKPASKRHFKNILVYKN